MKEEWLFRGALVPIDAATTAALVTEIKRLIDVVGGMALAQTYTEYDRGFSNGWNKCEERQALAQPEQWAPEDTAYRPGGLAQPEQPTIEQSLIVEQEPVAWLRVDGMKAMVADEKEAWIEAQQSELVAEYTIPLFTSPPKRQPLTDETLYELLYEKDFIQFARAIEAAHDIGDKT
jgi:hypothetical protein